MRAGQRAGVQESATQRRWLAGLVVTNVIAVPGLLVRLFPLG